MSTVNYPPNCSTQMLLKVMKACGRACAAFVASSTPPKGSFFKKGNPSSSINKGEEDCAAGKQAVFVREAALWRSYVGQCRSTWCTEFMLSGSPQAGQMRSSMSWVGYSLINGCCADASWKSLNAVGNVAKLPAKQLCHAT